MIKDAVKISERRYIAIACLSAGAAFMAVYLSGVPSIVVKIVTVLMILVTCAVSVYQVRKGKDRDRTLIACIMITGILMRICYMLCTPYQIRGYDIGMPGRNGHAEYILTIMQGRLPSSNDYQFYHPPLFHFLAAIMSGIYMSLKRVDIRESLEAGKLVSCWASIISLYLSRELFKEIRLGEKATLVSLCIAAFLPAHFLLAGRLNNDSLAVMFMIAVILYTIRWYRTRKMSDLIILALSYGLGMMSKMSVATLAAVTGTVMLYALFISFKNESQRCDGAREYRKTKKLFLQVLLFVSISFPLGLWFPIRNYVLFGQPLTYVLEMSREGNLYCGDYSLWERFGFVFDTYLYADPRRDYNVWLYLLRTSVFGEFAYEIYPAIAALLLEFNGILAISSLIASIEIFIRRKTSSTLVLTGFWSIMLISYVLFNLRYPFGCTMDFRYIVPTALIGSICLGNMMERLQGGGSDRKIVFELIYTILSIVLIGFCLLSCIMYIFAV